MYRRKLHGGLRKHSRRSYLIGLGGSQHTHKDKVGSSDRFDWSQIRVLYTKLLYLTKKNRKTPKVRLRFSLPRIKATRVKPYLFLNFGGRGNNRFRKPVQSLRGSVRALGRASKPRKTSYRVVRKPFRFRVRPKPNRLRLPRRRRLRVLHRSLRASVKQKPRYRMPIQTAAATFTQNLSYNPRLHYAAQYTRNRTKRGNFRVSSQKLLMRKVKTVFSKFVRLPKRYTFRKKPHYRFWRKKKVISSPYPTYRPEML